MKFFINTILFTMMLIGSNVRVNNTITSYPINISSEENNIQLEKVITIDNIENTTDTIISDVYNNQPSVDSSIEPVEEVFENNIHNEGDSLAKYNEVKLSYFTIQSFDLRTKHNLSLVEIQTLLKRFPTLYDLSETIYNYQNEYEVNTYFIIGLIRNESANGTSNLARNNNNLIGARVGGKWLSFSSKQASIKYLYNLISNNYLNKKGKFYNGMTLLDVNKKYCGSSTWFDTISNIMIKSYQELH